MNDIALFERQLTPLAPNFAQVLPAEVRPDRLIRTVVMSVERLPRLLQCDRQSLFNAAMSAAVLGLEVDGVTGQAFLIPFKGKAQLVVGYKGYSTIAARAGLTVTGAVVREGDLFEYELGSNAFVRHQPKLGNSARIIAAWAVAAHASRPPIVAVMGIDELLAVKGRSPAVKGGADTPWNDPAIGFPAMCEKAVKRRLARSLPLTMMQAAARLDEAVDEQGKSAWISPDKGVIVEGEVTPERETSPTPTAQQLIGPTEAPTEPSLTDLDDKLAEAATHGMLRLQQVWGGIAPEQQRSLKAALDRRHKPAAAGVDSKTEQPTGAML